MHQFIYVHMYLYLYVFVYCVFICITCLPILLLLVLSHIIMIYKHFIILFIYYDFKTRSLPVVPHKAVAEVSKIGNL